MQIFGFSDSVKKHKQIFSVQIVSSVSYTDTQQCKLLQLFVSWKKKKNTQFFKASLPFFQSTDMTNVIVNQCWAEPSQAHAVPTGHPALKKKVCMSAICCYFGHPLAPDSDTLIHIYWQVVRKKYI